MLDEKLRTGENVAYSLIEYKTKGADVDSMTTSNTGIQKLYVAILENSKLETLRHVVYLGGNDREWKLDLIFQVFVYIEQRNPFWVTSGYVDVLAAYLYHSFGFLFFAKVTFFLR